jgi:hypothetical protein
MDTNDETQTVQAEPARKRRSPLGCLGRAALGVLVFLAVILVAGAIYQATASASDAKQ